MSFGVKPPVLIVIQPGARSDWNAPVHRVDDHHGFASLNLAQLGAIMIEAYLADDIQHSRRLNRIHNRHKCSDPLSVRQPAQFFQGESRMALDFN